MKFLKTAALGAALSLCALAAQAQTTFNFAYTFDPSGTSTGAPMAITGSFTGTEIGNLISSISNVSLSLNGVAFSGPTVIEALDNSGNPSTSVTPIVSTDVAQTNFVFADTDMVNNSANVSNYFYISGGQAFAVDYNVTGNPTGTETATNAHWTVTAAAAVPEPSTYALMAAGLALVGMRLQRRRQA